MVKVFLIWLSILCALAVAAFLTSWNIVLISVITGAAVGFLPSYFLGAFAEMRKWNMENIEKIYAPLKKEIDNLAIYFTDVKKEEYAQDVFDYGEDRSKLLSMDEWLRIHKDNLVYRLSLDDRELLKELSDLYFALSYYIRNRTNFLDTTLTPIFRNIEKRLTKTDGERLRKIQVEITSMILDARLPSRDVALGFYRFTELPVDCAEICKKARMQEKSLEDFISMVFEIVKGEHYDLLLEQRRYLLKDAAKVKLRLDRKIEKALPF
jgi:hypothetical protein